MTSLTINEGEILEHQKSLRTKMTFYHFSDLQKRKK
jgi:hypothetical protein